VCRKDATLALYTNLSEPIGKFAVESDMQRLIITALFYMLGITPLAHAVQSRDIPQLLTIAAGDFISGSAAEEREQAYRLDEAAYQHRVTREQRWYDSERERGTEALPPYEITTTPLTNAQYHAFVIATGHRRPDVDEATWNQYGLIHPYARTRRHAWRDAGPPQGREQHPVVLISHHDAEQYAHWLSRETGQTWRLPTQSQWEKAVRGTQGQLFPWGDRFDAKNLNSHDDGPFDTVEVGRYPLGASAFGVLDGAGQVFEWIATQPGAQRAWVKGGSWDDKGCGVCRPAARHSRSVDLKHILIGFRLVRLPQ
jgi:formylglycine-generating enzyme required for sulfatase activity